MKVDVGVMMEEEETHPAIYYYYYYVVVDAAGAGGGLRSRRTPENGGMGLKGDGEATPWSTRTRRERKKHVGPGNLAQAA